MTIFLGEWRPSRSWLLRSCAHHSRARLKQGIIISDSASVSHFSTLSNSSPLAKSRFRRAKILHLLWSKVLHGNSLLAATLSLSCAERVTVKQSISNNFVHHSAMRWLYDVASELPGFQVSYLCFGQHVLVTKNGAWTPSWFESFFPPC